MRDSAIFEVREALAAPGCAVCHLALRSAQRQIEAISYSQVNDIQLREVLRRARGFCNPHAYQWLRQAHNVLGTALIYRDVLRASLADLDAPAAQRKRTWWRGTRAAASLRGLAAERGAAPSGAREPARSDKCPVCREQRSAEARYLDALVLVLAEDAAARADFDASDGLCRLHTLAALRSGGPAAGAIGAKARQRVEALVANLDEVIRKEDYRFRHEPRTDAERSAPGRAIAWAAGAEGLDS